jgi:apolipoprotein D and lipocalin family protein
MSCDNVPAIISGLQETFMNRPTRLLATIASSLLAACSSMPVGNLKVPEPAKSVQIDRYTGLWHEIARYQNSFEKGCEAVTAKYDVLEDGRIGILNSCHKGSVTGSLTTAAGKAKVVEGSNNTKLKVSFFGPFYLGDYWILDHADDYSWAIVGEPSGRYLWILTRSAHPDDKLVDELYTRVRNMGYDIGILRMVMQP